MPTSETKPDVRMPAEAQKNPLTRTLLGKFTRAIQTANKEDGKRLEQLAAAWNGEPLNNYRCSIPEATFIVGAEALGLGDLWHPDYPVENYAEDLCEFVKCLRRDDWLSECLSGLMDMHHRGSLRSLEDVMFSVEEDMAQERTMLENAQRILRDRPETLAADIRNAVEVLDAR